MKQKCGGMSAESESSFHKYSQKFFIVHKVIRLFGTGHVASCTGFFGNDQQSQLSHFMWIDSESLKGFNFV